MTTKTLDDFPSTAVSRAPLALPQQTPTYSISATPISIPAEQLFVAPEELELFLERENPLGCLRGVMWVMAFNLGAFLVGLAMWRSFKLFW